MLSGKFRFFLPACCFTMLSGCMQQSLHYEYVDGNANRYVITPSSLRYLPVTPEVSSSGMYSGGEPFEIKLSNRQYSGLRDLFEKAIAKQNSHIPNRIKGSGTIIRLSPKDTLKVIIQPHEALLLEIEMHLQQLKKS